MRRVSPSCLTVASILVLFAGAAAAQVPGEIQGVDFSNAQTLAWDSDGSAEFYNVYRGDLGVLGNGAPRCHGHPVDGTSFATPDPEPGTGYFYIVTGEAAAGEGTPGLESSGQSRATLGSCTNVVRHHVLNRLGFGWNEWTRDRVETLGLQGYVAEQLTPTLISESDNDELNDRLFDVFGAPPDPIEPPDDIIEQLQQQFIRGVYARRQLEQQVATFWANHFNTDWQKISELYIGAFPQCDDMGLPVQCDPNYPARGYYEASKNQHGEIEGFRQLAFKGNFREMLDLSSKSPAMIIYLDTIVSGFAIPNENYPRELLELHALGVDGGYTDDDIINLSKIYTGWRLCKKAPDDLDDPVAPCISEYWDDSVPGGIVATFLEGQHDCTAKTLFAATPQQIIIPDTCANPIDGVSDTKIALDAIAGHPSTKRFISKKLLQRFVTDDPTEAMIDVLVAEWNDAGNTHGVGDMGAVLEAALGMPEFLDPDGIGDKIKTPMEHFISSARAVRADIDGVTALISQTDHAGNEVYVVQAQHIPHYNPVPTGWAEDGGSWINTAGTLVRQNFGLHLAAEPEPGFNNDVIGLLLDNGVSTLPGNADAVIDFFNDALFGGALTPAERQLAIDYLSTDDNGTIAPYNNDRIRETVGILLGFPQFQEQ
ncbi:MAG: DUF1800 domain-containing protein [bacterium]|nr:DUF1800 domain-containing protein [bacterium]